MKHMRNLGMLGKTFCIKWWISWSQASQGLEACDGCIIYRTAKGYLLWILYIPPNSATPYDGVVAGGGPQQSVPLPESISFYGEIFHSSLEEYSLPTSLPYCMKMFLRGFKVAHKQAALNTIIWSSFDQTGLSFFESTPLHGILTF